MNMDGVMSADGDDAIDGEGDCGGSEGGVVSATAVSVAPTRLANTPTIFQTVKKSCPMYTAIANVNRPEVAERTVFDVTVVIERL